MNIILTTIVLVATATTQGQLLSAPKRRRTQYYHQRPHRQQQQQQQQHVSVIKQNIQAVAPKFRERVGESSIQWEKRRLVEPVEEILEEVKEERKLIVEESMPMASLSMIAEESMSMASLSMKLVVEESMSMASLSMIVESRFDIPADAEDTTLLDTSMSMSMSMQLLTELEFSFSMSMSYPTMETSADSTKEIYTDAGSSTHGNTLVYAGAVAGMSAMVLAAIAMFIKMHRVHARQIEEGCQDTKASVPPELADFDEELFVSVARGNSGACAIEQMDDNRSNPKNNSADLSWVNPV
jgi:hypothetical protein